MNASLLKPLLAGEYICPVRFRHEYEMLQDPSERELVNTWLNPLGYRLSRVGDDGAYFMSHQFIGPKEVAQVKAELIGFRDTYGPHVRMLDFIRQSRAENAFLGTGDTVQLVELEQAVNESGTLEGQLRTLLSVISAGSQRFTNRENLRKLCEHLAKDGYLVVRDKQIESYLVTGKIEQMYAVLQYLDENKAIPDDEVDDQMPPESQEDLLSEANLPPAEGQPS